ncbi:hypothetical protein N7530_009994 [Penicillium desertorum]|uniref:Uncharacterized protein n=1 Tax=Penicillium desertorum TaxID=1303715 RepID=A0A9W9WK48_9EURO|nr:hypothetical protein N7530_009994 [Penicillium desertorum]
MDRQLLHPGQYSNGSHLR